MNKTLLLASFVFLDTLESRKEHLKENFNIDEKNIFIYEIEGEKEKFLFTFKIIVENGERLDIKKHFKNTILIHKKSSTLYTINALNEIIISEHSLNPLLKHNFKDYKISWENHKDKLLMINNNNLISLTLNRIFP